jgi:hypothetical protein
MVSAFAGWGALKLMLEMQLNNYRQQISAAICYRKNFKQGTQTRSIEKIAWSLYKDDMAVKDSGGER